MKKALHILDHAEEYLITLILPVMCLVVVLATTARVTMFFSMPWGEEMTRYLMVWLVFLGAGLAVKSDAHFNVVALVNLFPLAGRRFFYYFRQLVLAGLAVFILYYGVGILEVQMGMDQLSPAMEIPIWTIYLAIPVCGVSIVIRSFINIWLCVRGRKEV